MTNLLNQKCQHRAGSPLGETEIQDHLAQLSSWRHHDGAIEKAFSFKNYLETIAFVNALAWIAHTEDHHPELTVSYGRCMVRFSTHSVNGYHIQALDGTIGQVTGFFVDDRQWTIHDLVVETHWFVGKDVRISSKKIERISYEESKVFVSLTQADIEGTEENKIARHHANKVGQP